MQNEIFVNICNFNRITAQISLLFSNYNLILFLDSREIFIGNFSFFVFVVLNFLFICLLLSLTLSMIIIRFSQLFITFFSVRLSFASFVYLVTHIHIDTDCLSCSRTLSHCVYLCRVDSVVDTLVFCFAR